MDTPLTCRIVKVYGEEADSGFRHGMWGSLVSCRRSISFTFQLPVYPGRKLLIRPIQIEPGLFAFRLT